MREIIKQKAEFIVSLTGFGTSLHVNDILPDLREIGDSAYENVFIEVENMKKNLTHKECEAGTCEICDGCLAQTIYNTALLDVLGLISIIRKEVLPRVK